MSNLGQDGILTTMQHELFLFVVVFMFPNMQRNIQSHLVIKHAESSKPQEREV